MTLRVKVYDESNYIQMNTQENQSSEDATALSCSSLPHYLRSEIPLGQTMMGPALILESVSTTFLAKNWSCKVDSDGNLLLKKQPH